MELLTAMIHRLYERGHLKTCKPAEDHTTYSYEYMGRLVKQAVTVDVRMKRTELLRIVNRAYNGSPEDMHTLAMLYNTGYGVPFDRERAILWMRFATQQGMYYDTFGAAYQRALIEAQNCPETIFPDPIIYPCLDIIQKIHDVHSDSKLRLGCAVMPRLEGIRVYLIYRHVPGVTPHLYAGFYHDGENYFMALDKLVALGVPRYFGEIRDKVIINDYAPFGNNTMYVVAGTIYVPESKRADQTHMEVFNSFMTDDSTPLTRAHFDIEDDKAALEEAIKTVNKLEKQRERLAGLNREFPEESLKALKKAKKQRRILREFLANADPDVDYQRYLDSRPEARLRFVASELYRWNRRLGLHTVPMGRQGQQHLSSIGFTSLDHPTLEFAGWIADHTDVAKTVNMYERALDAKVKSLIMFPAPNSSARFVDVSRIEL